MENITNIELELLTEADLFADELEEHFNNAAAAGTSSLSSLSSFSGCFCTAGCFCTQENAMQA